MRINDDLVRAIDDNACVILVLLDLSAAFDTVDHQISLTQLVAMVSRVMDWLGCAHISQISSNMSECGMIVHLSTNYPVVFHTDVC